MEGIGILRAYHVVVVLPHKLVIAEVDELVAHRRTDDVERIAEVFGLDRVPGDVELKAAVAHGAHINEGFIEQVGRDGDFVVAQQVLLSATVVVERTVEGTVEQCPVEADVPVLAFLPAQVGVDVLARSPHLVVLAVVGVVAEALHGVQRLVTVEVLVARHAIVGAQFQVGEPALGLCHERLVGDTPPYGDGGEVTPLVVFTKLGRTLVSQRGCQHVASFPVVAHAAEESNEFGIVHIRAHIDFSLFLGKCSCAQVVVFQGIIGEVFVVGVQSRVLLILVRVTQHGLDVVIAKGVVVVGNPFQTAQCGLGVILRSLACATCIDGECAGRRAEELVVVVVLMVGKGELGREHLFAGILQQQWKEIQFYRAVPVEQLGRTGVLVKFHKLYRVVSS